MVRHHSDLVTKEPPKDLSVIWVNVSRMAAPHNTTLNLAIERNVDVVCVQEPYTGPETSTQTNPAFQMYAPVDSWDWENLEEKEIVRPKVLTYVKKVPEIRVQQRRPIQCRDHLWLNVNGFSILNIYRQPGNDTVLDYVISLNPPAKCIVGGDFNVHHDLFEPGVNTFGRGGELATWSSESMMDYIGEAGVPTHDKGHVLDLTFSNIVFTYTSVFPELHSGSDHATQVTIIPGYGDTPNSKPLYRVTEADLGRLSGLVEIGFQALENPIEMRTSVELDVFAQAMEEIFRIAIEKGSRANRARNGAAEWWTDECRRAHAKYIATKVSIGQSRFSKKKFLTTVRKAKRGYWKRIIDGATDSSAIYKVIGWHKQSPRLKAPPLKLGDEIIEDTMEKAEAVRT